MASGSEKRAAMPAEHESGKDNTRYPPRDQMDGIGQSRKRVSDDPARSFDFIHGCRRVCNWVVYRAGGARWQVNLM